jgi:3-phenylpropionate/trans-cinnamate dioxygenase ferredoxin reductase subunit
MNEPTVIVGASVAGVRAAQTLRQRGFDGKLILLDAEPGPPYDKPPLSKEVLTEGNDPPPLLTRQQLTELDYRPESVVESVDFRTRTIGIRGEPPLTWTRLLIATGSVPRRLPALNGVAGVHYLRTRRDAATLHEALRRGSPRVVVIGGGFIGAEVAAGARRLGLDVTIVEAAPRMLARVLPAEVGAAVEALHNDHGVRVRCGTSVRGHRGADRIETLELTDGSLLPADLVVVGIGTEPATDWLPGVHDRLVCGSDLTVQGLTGVYAAGDVARWFNVASGRHERTEHWTAAREQGRLAALNLLAPDRPREYRHLPYVWSDQYGTTIQHVGRVPPNGTTRLAPRSSDDGTLFLHLDGERVTGATGFGAQRQIATIRRELSLQDHPASLAG